MKKMKRLLVTVCIVGLICALSGCSMTPEKLLLKMQEAYEGRVCTGMDIELPLEMAFTVGEKSSELSMDTEFTMDLVPDETNTFTDAYVELDFDAAIDGEESADRIQLYIENDGETITVFAHLEDDDVWARVDTPIGSVAENTEMVEIDPSMLTLAEETQQVDGTEVYVLSYTITGEEMQKSWDEAIAVSDEDMDALNTMLEKAGMKDFDINSIDVSMLEASFVMYVNTETYEIVKVEFSFRNLGNFITEFMDAIVAILPEEAQKNTDTMAFECDDITLSISNLRFDGTEVKKISEENRIRATLESFNPDLGNNVYAIQDEGDAIQFTAPDDWVAKTLTPSFISFTNEKETISCSIEIVNGFTSKDCLNFVKKEYLAEVKKTFGSRGSGTKENIGDYETFFIKYYSDFFFFAWKEVDDSMVLVCVFDTKKTDIVKSLSPILDRIEPYEIQY